MGLSSVTSGFAAVNEPSSNKFLRRAARYRSPLLLASDALKDTDNAFSIEGFICDEFSVTST